MATNGKALPTNGDHAKLVGDCYELNQTRRMEYGELEQRVPYVPTAMVHAFADDVSTVLQAHLGPNTVAGELVCEIIMLLTDGADPLRFARAAMLYERLGGEFENSLSGNIDRIRPNGASCQKV